MKDSAHSAADHSCILKCLLFSMDFAKQLRSKFYFLLDAANEQAAPPELCRKRREKGGCSHGKMRRELKSAFQNCRPLQQIKFDVEKQ